MAEQSALPPALYLPQFFSSDESTLFFQNLQTEISWKHEPITMFGKKVMQPRLTALYGNADKPYRYSGHTMAPLEWTETLLKIKRRIEPLAKAEFTTVLLNLYRNQSDGMGWHRDNERELGPTPIIGSVSFGATRTFQMRRYVGKTGKIDFELEHGSLLVMRDDSQQNWEHAVPRRARSIGPRINLTFRVLL